MWNFRLSSWCWQGFLDCFCPWSWRHNDPSKGREPLIRNSATSQRSWILASSPVWVLFHNGVNCQDDLASMFEGEMSMVHWRNYTDSGKHRYSEKKTCPSDITYTKNTKWTDLGSNPDLQVERRLRTQRNSNVLCPRIQKFKHCMKLLYK